MRVGLVLALVLLAGVSFASGQKYKRGDQVPLFANKVKNAPSRQSKWQKPSCDPPPSHRWARLRIRVSSMSTIRYLFAHPGRRSARVSTLERC